MGQRRIVKVGLLGLGVVGGGVASILTQKAERFTRELGCPLQLARVLVRDLSKERAVDLDADILTTDSATILEDPEVNIVIEVMGGEEPAHQYIRKALQAGKYVVTANKEVLAKHGATLLALAREHGVDILYEASVGGGIPIIAPLKRDLLANEIVAITAIINGTTNYILTAMSQEGRPVQDALAQAQALGYAEIDPTNDISGTDAAYKLAILSTLSFRARVKDTDVHREGITRLTASDFLYASELGYAIKLLAIASKEDGAVQVRVHPAFVPADVMIAKVDGVMNAVEIETDLAGRVLFHGRGAGSMPTTSAVIADIVDIARNLAGNVVPPSPLKLSEDVRIRPMSDLETKYYLRLHVADRSGVLAQIASVLGDLDISIASFIQKQSDEVAQTAEIVLMTHRASEASMQKAIQRLEALEVVVSVGNMVRVEEWQG